MTVIKLRMRMSDPLQSDPRANTQLLRLLERILSNILEAGLHMHTSFHPTIGDGSTWRTWRCFPVLQLRCALILREPCSGFTCDDV